MEVRVQRENFDVTAVVERLTRAHPEVGAVATFRGVVRDRNPSDPLVALELEHYPGMTLKAIEEIAAEAARRWDIDDGLIIHRYGRLQTGDTIVLVAVSAAHRSAAFDSVHFLIDWLKTKAPFWKKEIRQSGAEWVEARAGDDEATDRW